MALVLILGISLWQKGWPFETFRIAAFSCKARTFLVFGRASKHLDRLLNFLTRFLGLPFLP